MKDKEEKFRKLSFCLIIMGIILGIAYSGYFVMSKTVGQAPPSRAATCHKPISLISSSPYVIEQPDIFGRTIVFTSNNNPGMGIGQLSFYDAGPDYKFGTLDDLGIIQPASLQQPGFSYTAPKIYGENIVSILSNPSGQKQLFLYSLGPDMIAGTLDDLGPTLLYQTMPPYDLPPEYLHIDLNVVTFDLFDYATGDYSIYSCTTDYPTGTCWTGVSIAQQVQIPSYQSYFQDSIQTLNIFGNPFVLFEWVTSGPRINFHDLTTSQQGQFYPTTSNATFEFIEDASFPFIVSSASHPSQANSKIRVGLIYYGMPYLQITPASLNSVSDTKASISRVASPRGYNLLTWTRTNQVTMAPAYMVTSIMSAASSASSLASSSYPVTIPANAIIPFYGPRAYQDTVMLSNTRAISTAECYF